MNTFLDGSLNRYYEDHMWILYRKVSIFIPYFTQAEFRDYCNMLDGCVFE